MLSVAPSVQSPRAYDLNNLQGAALGGRLALAASATMRANLRTALQDAGYRYTITPGETSAGLVAADLTFGFDPGDCRRYGASPGADPADNRTAIQRALSSELRVRVAEAYEIDAELALRSGQTIVFDSGGSITLTDGVTDEYIFHGDTVDNVRFVDAVIYGNGASGLSAVFLEDSTDVLFDRCTIKYAGSMAILLRTCSRILVDHCELSENYGYSIEDKNGTGNRYTNNRCNGNGDTGSASHGGGRGIVLWMCVDCTVASNRFVGNTEYGFRIYAEAADSAVSQGNHIINNFFQDNTSADLVLYDESLAGDLVYRNVVSGNVAIRTTAPTLGQSFLLHGGNNTIENCHVYKEGTFGAFDAFYLYYAVGTKLVNCSAHNLANAIVFSNAENCVIDGFVGNGVATACGVAGLSLSGNTVRNSEFTHGGVGAADVGIVTYNATGKNFVENVRLDGFNYGVYSGSEAIRLRNVTTLNSTTNGWRKDNDAQAGQEIIANSWDSVNPAVLQDIERRDGSKAYGRYTAAPTVKTWAVGDRVFNSAPSAGNPKSWVCTTAGTPGTWTSEGNL